jgi:hypothetical protein
MDDTIIESGRVISRETAIILTGSKNDGRSGESLTLASFTSTICSAAAAAAAAGDPLPSTPRQAGVASAASGLDSDRYAGMASAANMTPELVDGHQEDQSKPP